GPMLFTELEAAAPFQRRLALTTSQYLQRLDGFVAKYAEGGPPESLGDFSARVTVIPNGVPRPSETDPASLSSSADTVDTVVSADEAPPPFETDTTPEQTPLLPSWIDPERVIGTCCRITPSKRIEFLIEMMQELTARVPQASLVI